MNLLAWLRPTRRLQVIRRSETKLRLHEWRSAKDLVAAAGRIWANPDFQMMFSVLRNEHPGCTEVLAYDVHPNFNLAVQRRAEGYTLALANLEAMAKMEIPAERLEATFEEEEIADK